MRDTKPGDLVRRRDEPTCVGIVVALRPFTVRRTVGTMTTDRELWERLQKDAPAVKRTGSQ